MVRIVQKNARTTISLVILSIVILFVFAILFQIANANNFGSNGFANLRVWSPGTLDPAYNQTNGTLYSKDIYSWDFLFFANFTNSSNVSINSSNGNGNCQIMFNETGTYSSLFDMNYDSSLALFDYNRSFKYKGNLSYQVLCNSSFGNLTLKDYFFVRNTPLYINLNKIINLNTTEDNASTFLVNYSQYIFEDDKNDVLTYSIENISSNNYPTHNDPAFYYWISINSSTGIINSSAIYENQTGNFYINIRTSDTGNTGSDGEVVIKGVSLLINPVNDAPTFTNLVDKILTERIPFEYIINTSDEEGNYPFVFNVSFLGCSVAEFSSRNCSTEIGRKLFNYTVNESTGIINISFTPNKDDVGNFTINFSVTDSNSYELPFNASSSKVVVFSVMNNNTAPAFNYVCDNERNWTEGQTLNCQINVTDVDEYSNLTLTTFSDVTGGKASYTSVSNSWFALDNGFNVQTKPVNLSTNHQASFSVNVSLTSGNVGNWSINLTLKDNGVPLGINSTSFLLSVRPINHSVTLNAQEDLVLFTSSNYTIELNATDDDILIPDKRAYNESITFASNTSWVTVQSRYFQPGTNIMSARLFINPGLAGSGNFTIKINVSDANGFSYNEKTFNILIYQNIPPVWSKKNYTYYLIEDTNFSLPINLTVLANDSDDGSNINFSYSIDNFGEVNFPNFNLNSQTGIINFTPDDMDVGRHNLTINVTDVKGAVASAKFYFIINNTAEAPNITQIETRQVSVENYTWNPGNRTMYIKEDSFAHIYYLYVSDDDLLINISQKNNFYYENLSFITNIANYSGGQSNFFNFTVTPIAYQNISLYEANFVPRKKDVGNYTVNLKVTDKAGLNGTFSFNLTVIEVQHPPNITNLAKYEFNLSYLENFSLDVNASDLEDGDKTAGLLNFSLITLNGATFLSINLTSGLISNISQLSAGIWNFTIKVKDSSGLNDSKNITLLIYDYPVIDWPIVDTEFNNFYENKTNMLLIRVNHTIQNPLTYFTYLNGSLRNLTIGPGNETYFNISIVTDFSDETTCSGKVNLTINVSNIKLSSIESWNLTVLHVNYPITNISNIGGIDSYINVTNSLTDNLRDYFYDPDYTDSCVIQHIGFVSNYLNGDNITISLTNITNLTGGSVTFSYGAKDHSIGNYSITAIEYNESNSSQAIGSVTSNVFTIEVTKVSDNITQEVPQSSGGGNGRTTVTEQPVYRPISFKIILPDPISAEKKDKLILPIKLANTGGFVLNGIMLYSNVVKNGSIVQDVITGFSDNNFTILSPNQTISLNLSVDLNTELSGSFEININATVNSPAYSDWGKIYLTVKEGSNIDEKVIFTEELIAKNPECAEIKELVDDAKKTLKAGNVSQAEMQIDSAVNACKEAITQKSRPVFSPILSSFGITDYVLFASIASVTIGILFYFYKRVQLRKALELSNKGEFDY